MRRFCVILGHLVCKDNFIMFEKPASLTQKRFVFVLNEPLRSQFPNPPIKICNKNLSKIANLVTLSMYSLQVLQVV